jgi:hypothetical protein
MSFRGYLYLKREIIALSPLTVISSWYEIRQIPVLTRPDPARPGAFRAVWTANLFSRF